MAERYPVYATADVTVPTRDERKEVIADEVIDALADAACGDRGGSGVTSELRVTTVNVGLGERAYDILIGAGLIARAGSEIAARLPGIRVGCRHRRERRGRASCGADREPRRGRHRQCRRSRCRPARRPRASPRCRTWSTASLPPGSNAATRSSRSAAA